MMPTRAAPAAGAAAVTSTLVGTIPAKSLTCVARWQPSVRRYPPGETGAARRRGPLDPRKGARARLRRVRGRRRREETRLSTLPPPRATAGWVALGVVALLVAGGAALVVLATDPFVASAPTVCPEGSRRLPTDEGAATTVCLPSNIDATEIAYGVTIRNDGRLPARIRSVPPTQFARGGFTPTAIREGPPPDPGDRPDDPAAWPELSSVTLAADEERMLWIEGELEACDERTVGRATQVPGMFFRMSRLGLPREAEIQLNPAMGWIVEVC